MEKIKSPLRYPGGKTRLAKQIADKIGDDFDEYREPMVGGGAVFFELWNRFGRQKQYWLNDVNQDLFYFWYSVKHHPVQLTSIIRSIKQDYEGKGRELFQFMQEGRIPFNCVWARGARYFILNRISYSGAVDSSGYSESAFNDRFTESSIDRITEAAKALAYAHVSGDDYFQSFTLRPTAYTEGKVVIYVDPPYYANKDSRLYGKGGQLHTEFDHERLNRGLMQCQYDWLLSYDDCSKVRELYQYHTVKEVSAGYSWRGSKKVKELLIRRKVEAQDYKTLRGLPFRQRMDIL